MEENGKKVFVGMSGGVDSSVSAALLKQKGFDVTGVFIKVWHPDFMPCTWKDDRVDAMRVCAILDIPFVTLDFGAEYKKEVVEYLLAEYKAGRTPNPDVMCNKHIKFGVFLKYAREQGADFVATGHYAQNVRNPETELFELHKGADENKDQTYFLWTLTQDDLRHIIFPVGEFKKSYVRELAEKFGLPTANKKDSQGLCFVGKVPMKDFLKNFIDPKEGVVLNESGKTIGTHDGAYFYTLGQRHGFAIKAQHPNESPHYVIGKNVKENTITVSQRPTDSTYNKNKITLSKTNWIGNSPGEKEMCDGRYRYRQTLFPCKILLSKDGTKILLQETHGAIAKGQSFVLYKETKCLGGGVIE